MISAIAVEGLEGFNIASSRYRAVKYQQGEAEKQLNSGASPPTASPS